jgi:TRAP-type C4-dicarboxylate transport system permease small subunit
MQRAMRRVDRVLTIVENASALGAGLAAILMMLLIFRDALGRYLFGAPVSGTFETVERYLMIALVWLGAARTHRIGRHVSVDAFVRRFSGRVQAAFRLLPSLAAFLLWAIVAWSAIMRSIDRWDTMLTTTVIPLRVGAAWSLLAIGASLLCIRILFDAIGGLFVTTAEEPDAKQEGA